MSVNDSEQRDVYDRRLVVVAIEDDDADAEALRRCLAAIPGLPAEFVHCREVEAGLKALARTDADVLVLDYLLGADCGLEVVRRLRAAGDARAVVVLTGHGNEYIAAELTRAGVDDYLVKADLSPELLRRALEHAMAECKRRKAEAELYRRSERIELLSRQLAESNIQLAQSSRIDFLTQILTRAAWAESAALEHQRSIRHGHEYCVLMIDVDHFKQYNDTLGHQKGDDSLIQVARCLSRTCRCFDLVARYGGEEFVVLAPETSLEGGATLAERVRQSVYDAALPHPSPVSSGRITVSVGVCGGPLDRWEKAVQHADEALYKAKRAGRDRVCVHQPYAAAGGGSRSARP